MASSSDIPQPRRGRRAFALWAFRLVLLLVGIAFPLLALELALRAFGPFLPGNYSAHLYLEPHPTFGRFHTPSSTGWIRTEEYIARVDINSRGLREREIPYEKPSGRRRVLVLGDSFVEGAEVPQESTVTRRLEAILGNASGNVEVINAGVRAFGTAQEYLLLQHEGLRYAPDTVVLVFYIGNDVSNNSARIEHNVNDRKKPYFTVNRQGDLRMLSFRPKRADRQTLTEKLRRDSMLFGVLDTGVLAKLRPSTPPDESENADEDSRRPDEQLLKFELPVYAAEPTGEWEESWEVTEALLRETTRLARGAGADFLLVGAPAKWEVYPEDWQELVERNGLKPAEFDLDGPNRRLREIATRQGIPYLDLRPGLREVATQRPRLYFHRDVHWTVSGHQRAAELLSEALLPTR